jgi:3-oxoacyl-[acyl-carrier-protein] synthase-3
MSTKAYISAISYYLPKYVLSNQVIEKDFPEWSIDKISEKTGISNRYISSKNETSGDMAVEAANILFKEHDIDRLFFTYNSLYSSR